MIRHRHHNTGSPLLPLLLTTVVLLAVCSQAHSRPIDSPGSQVVLKTASEHDPRLSEARRHIEHARYDSALVVLDQLAIDDSAPEELRSETFRLLGLVHTLMGHRDDAKDAIRNWILTEKTVVVPDPDRELLAFIHLYYEVRKELNEQKYCADDFRPPDPCQFLIERPDPGIQTLAIVPFGNNAVDERNRLAPLSDGLADLLIRQLSGAIGLQIVEREWLEWLLREIDLNQERVIDDRTAMRIGRLLGAHAVLLGDFMYLNETFTVGARLVKVESGEVLLVASEEGPLDAFGTLTGKLSEKIARAAGGKIQSGEWKTHTPSNDLGALLSYAEGLALYDEGDFTAAAEKFEEALSFDPNHHPAKQRYDSLQPLLAGSVGFGR